MMGGGSCGESSVTASLHSRAMNVVGGRIENWGLGVILIINFILMMRMTYDSECYM